MYILIYFGFGYLELPFKGLKRAVRRSTSEPDEGLDDNDLEGGIEDQAPPDDNHTIIRLLEPNEKVKTKIFCIILDIKNLT